MTVLLLYSGHDGQTAAIMSAIAKEISAVTRYELYDLHCLPPINLSDYQLVVVGAAIRYGYFNKKMKRFIQKNAQQLNAMPSAFYSVTLTARKPEKRTPETNLYTKKFLATIPWKPAYCQVFAGALRYPRYTWYDRMMIRFIMKITGGETDTSKDIEYTDWQQVTQFAHQLINKFIKITN